MPTSSPPSSPLFPHPLRPLPHLPPSAYYLPTFLTPAEESSLLSTIASQPPRTWHQLSHRRLQAHPSVLSASNTLLAQELPGWLDGVVGRLGEVLLRVGDEREGRGDEERGGGANGGEDGGREGGGKEGKGQGKRIFENSPHGAPNHVLINEYKPGEGILPHEDGSAYFPVVCTVSLGAHTVLDIYSKGEKGRRWRVLQERRSLLVTMGECYAGCLHGIEGVEVDEGLGPGEVVNWELLREETRGEVEREGGGCGGG